MGEHRLIPSIGRDWREGELPFSGYEKKVFDDFRRRALPWLDFRPRTDWEWLMLAQHHGVPTRLLDWTTNPLVALFFACCDDGEWDHDGCVFLLPELERLNPDAHKSPFDIDGNYLLEPPHLSPRVMAQSAMFTVGQTPTNPLTDTRCRRVSVAGEHKQFLLQDLRRLGVHHASLFPGLDGLGKAIRFDGIHEKCNHRMPASIEEASKEAAG